MTTIQTVLSSHLQKVNENKYTEASGVHVIVAPHIDDEVIGCFDILSNPDNTCVIIYSGFDNTQEREQEAHNLVEKFENVVGCIKNRYIPSQFLSPNNFFHFPDPFNEHHPTHRVIGMLGYELFHDKGFSVFFYSINMQAPYIYNVDNWQEKQKILNELYPSQKSLWENDFKYFLFEGHCQFVPGKIWSCRD